ncbi:MAG: hypothetical protein M3R24_14275 [Chloroflexota bacterium]|nr:hypothetical protein [Chloroflexota bacterium]
MTSSLPQLVAWRHHEVVDNTPAGKREARYKHEGEDDTEYDDETKGERDRSKLNHGGPPYTDDIHRARFPEPVVGNTTGPGKRGIKGERLWLADVGPRTASRAKVLYAQLNNGLLGVVQLHRCECECRGIDVLVG